MADSFWFKLQSYPRIAINDMAYCSNMELLVVLSLLEQSRYMCIDSSMKIF